MASLVIVESPAKAKTINKILGKGFDVKASVGHIKDLPESKLGVNIDADFEPDYRVIPGKEKVIKELKRAAKGADKIFLAPDPDREGEAIAYHVASEIAGGDDKVFRVSFNEITEQAVKKAISNPVRIDMNKVHAQQARRVLDRLVGYNLSPLLWKKIKRGLSAGRVQSVAVRLVVEREREIEAFKQEEYWSITARLDASNPPEFEAKLHKYGNAEVINRDAEEGKRFLITNGDDANRIAGEITKSSLMVLSIDKRTAKRNPKPPFITSTLQQEASRKLGYSAKKTMQVAQGLYEGVELGADGSHGLITYMRTDSVRIASEAQKWAHDFIAKEFGKDYAPSAPPKYKTKSSAQDAHEAIRPTSPQYTPDAIVKYLASDQIKLYTLIWNRFISSQMMPAELDQTTIDITCSTEPESLLRATGSIVRFPGFMALYTETQDDQEEEERGFLPPLKEGEEVRLTSIEPKQHFTQPPPRYTEASLVKALEENGIGRPSTYASILSTVVDRHYVKKEEKRLHPTELGALVNDYLVVNFPELMDSGFTAKMEDKLDSIEEGKHKWAQVIGEFYKPFSTDLETAGKSEERVKPADIETEQMCEKCGKPMVIRWGRHGRFMACSGYPECKNAKPIDSEGKPQEEVPTDEKCQLCGTSMVLKSGRFGRFYACTKYPECKGTKPISTGVKCPEDGGDIIQRRTKTGRIFWSCSNYPKCKFSAWLRPINEKCPGCGSSYMLVTKDKSGAEIKTCPNKECNIKTKT